jgi:hypothetical protein
MNENEQTRVLVSLTGIKLPAERVAGVAGGLSGTKRVVEMLAALDLSSNEPAAQFRAPHTLAR